MKKGIIGKKIGMTQIFDEKGNVVIPFGDLYEVDYDETYQGEETIVIPENVTQIEDYAFSNCAGLKQIVLEQKDPSKCIVGQHLLDGTGAEILVPQMSVDSYKRNYFWSVYAGRIGEVTAHAEK